MKARVIEKKLREKTPSPSTRDFIKRSMTDDLYYIVNKCEENQDAKFINNRGRKR